MLRNGSQLHYSAAGRTICLAGILLLSTGCVTATGRLGTAQVKQVLDETARDGAAPGEPRVVQAARVQAALKKQVGAPAQVNSPSTEQLAATADRMEAENIAIETAWNWLKALVPKIPYVGGALAAAWGVWETVRKSRLAAATTTAVGAINRFKHLAERLKDALAKPDDATNWDGMGRDAAILLDELKAAGKEGTAAWKELTAIHAALKEKGKVVDSVGLTGG